MQHYKNFYRVTELQEVGVGGRTRVYQLIAEGRLRAVKNGKMTLIDGRSVERYLEGLPPLELATAS